MKTLKLFGLVILTVFWAGNILAQNKQDATDTKKEDVFIKVEDMPEYPGGDKALRNDIAALIKYPEEAKAKKIEGKVYVTFIVDENGKVINAKIARGVDPLLDAEAIRVVELLKTWKPGKQRGQVVKVSYTVPINFALN